MGGLLKHPSIVFRAEGKSDLLQPMIAALLKKGYRWVTPDTSEPNEYFCIGNETRLIGYFRFAALDFSHFKQFLLNEKIQLQILNSLTTPEQSNNLIN